MSVKQINHIGIAVKSIEDQRPFYEGALGFFRVGDVRLELLEPTDPTSTVAKFLDQRGEGLHHIAFTVSDLPLRLAELKQQGLRLIDETPRNGAHHMRIAFLHPKSTGGVLTELCEPQSGTCEKTQIPST
jgi:methylmalonyl-CoA/ethylmalonyl-CoA epimerase